MHHRTIIISLVFSFILILLSCESDTPSALYSTPNKVNLGSVGVNDTITFSITLHKQSKKDVTLEELSITNDEPGEWTFISDNLPSTLDDENNSVIITFEFKPTLIGNKNITLRIKYAPKNRIHKIKIRAEAIESPLIAAEPNNHNFGKLILFEELTFDFVISNTGLNNLFIEAIDTRGDLAKEFEILNQEPDFNIPPSEDMILTIKFSPTLIGDKLVRVRIFHDGTNIESPISLELSGEGVNAAPIFNINPDYWDFESVIQYEKVEKTFSIENTGVLNLFILSISIVTDHPEYFKIISGIAPFSIAPRASARFVIEFNPERISNFTAAMEIEHNADDSPAFIIIEGKGIEGTQVIFSEDWNSSGGVFPSDWTIIDGGTNNGTNFSTWYLEGPSGNWTLGNGWTAACNSHKAGTNTILEEFLESPEIDCSAYLDGKIEVKFNANFQYFPNSFDDYATFEVFDGADWIIIDTYDESFDNFYAGESKLYDVSTYALGNPEFKIRFFYTGNYDWFFMVDDIVVQHTP